MTELIKKLRDDRMWHLGLQKALESNNNLEEAALWLRKKGIIKAAKKMDRDALEGAVGVVTHGNWGAILKIASETDFVARNEKFQSFMQNLLSEIGKHRLSSLEALKAHVLPSGQNAEDETAALTGVIGESIRLEGLESVEADSVFSYIHNAYTPTLGRIAVLVGLKGQDTEASKELGEQLAMHVAASPSLSPVMRWIKSVLKKSVSFLKRKPKPLASQK